MGALSALSSRLFTGGFAVSVTGLVAMAKTARSMPPMRSMRCRGTGISVDNLGEVPPSSPALSPTCSPRAQEAFVRLLRPLADRWKARQSLSALASASEIPQPAGNCARQTKCCST